MKYLLICLFLIGCSTVNNERVAPDPKLGEEYGGGIVFYLLQEGDPGYDVDQKHGFIVAPYDEVDSKWGCYEANKLNFSYFLGDGDLNTEVIISSCPGENAAYECIISTQNKKFDWYLPNYEEFNILVRSNLAPNLIISSYYWVSTKLDNFNAYCYRPSDRDIRGKDVNNVLKVRPIRKF